MSIGWFLDLNEANDYFINERLETDAWNNLANDAIKMKAIKNSYNRIFYDPRYDVPTYATATVAQLIKLKIINGEMAYYLALHLADEDRRKGLIAQGVTDAGIVKEKYDRDKINDLPIPPFVDAMLGDLGFKTVKAFGIVNLERDEDESVDTKVDEF